MKMEIKDFVRRMPKIEQNPIVMIGVFKELHAHLNGSLTTDALIELGAEVHGETTKEFKVLCDSFKQIENLSLSECFQKFQIAHNLTVTENGLKKATLSVIRDFSSDNVVYLELRTTPKTTEHMSKEVYLRTVLAAIACAKFLYPDICVKLLPSIDRSKGIEDAIETLEIVVKALESHSDVIKGLDFSGNPAMGSFETYGTILNKARKNNLKLAVHCAEIDNNKETYEMLQFGMDRCGHGTFMSQENLSIIKEKNIPIECCLSSNVKCGTVKSYEDHHFKTLHTSNHPVVLCTDDFGVFDTNLSNEYILALETFSLSKNDLEKLSSTAIDISFANESEKKLLKGAVNNYFAQNEIN